MENTFTEKGKKEPQRRQERKEKKYPREILRVLRVFAVKNPLFSVKSEVNNDKVC
jgi:hypothetical protein